MSETGKMDTETTAKVIDLMQVLKESLAKGAPHLCPRCRSLAHPTMTCAEKDKADRIQGDIDERNYEGDLMRQIEGEEGREP